MRICASLTAVFNQVAARQNRPLCSSSRQPCLPNQGHPHTSARLHDWSNQLVGKSKTISNHVTSFHYLSLPWFININHLVWRVARHSQWLSSCSHHCKLHKLSSLRHLKKSCMISLEVGCLRFARLSSALPSLPLVHYRITSYSLLLLLHAAFLDACVQLGTTRAKRLVCRAAFDCIVRTGVLSWQAAYDGPSLLVLTMFTDSSRASNSPWLRRETPRSCHRKERFQHHSCWSRCQSRPECWVGLNKAGSDHRENHALAGPYIISWTQSMHIYLALEHFFGGSRQKNGAENEPQKKDAKLAQKQHKVVLRYHIFWLRSRI